MNEILAVVKKDLREILRIKSVLMGIGAAIFILYFLISIAGDNINAIMESEVMAVEPAGYIQAVIGGSLFTVALVITFYFCFLINSYTLLIEKTKRSLESLLCTPLSLRQFMVAKAMAMFVPGMVFGLVLTAGAFCLVNIYVVSPEVGHWIYPGVAPLVAILIGIPPVILFLSILFYLLQLIMSNVRLINGIFMVLLMGTLNGLMFTLRLSTSAWLAVYTSLGAAVVLAVSVFFVSRLLTKERIILSSKG
jgi:ABC-2 type transport system permease protein